MKIHTYNAKRNSAPPLYDNVRNFRTRGFGLATSRNFNFCFQGHNRFLPSIFCVALDSNAKNGISQRLRNFPRPRGVTIKDRCFGYFRNLSWFLEQVPPGNMWKSCIPPAGYLQNVQPQKRLEFPCSLRGKISYTFGIHLVYMDL